VVWSLECTDEGEESAYSGPGDVDGTHEQEDPRELRAGRPDQALAVVELGRARGWCGMQRWGEKAVLASRVEEGGREKAGESGACATPWKMAATMRKGPRSPLIAPSLLS